MEPMNTEIRLAAIYLGYDDITEQDIDVIKERFSHNLFRNGQLWKPGIRAALRAYFSEN